MGVFEDVLSQTSRKPGGISAVLERRVRARLPHWSASQTSMTSHLWELDLIPTAELHTIVHDVRELAGRCIDRNLFFEPEVLTATWPRLTSSIAPKGAWVLALWETTPKARRLRLSMPVSVVKTGFPRQRVMQVLSNDFFTLGTPLIDKAVAEEAIETLLRLLADPKIDLPKVIDFRHLRKDDQALSLLLNAAASLGLPVANCREHERAALRKPPGAPETTTRSLSAKRAREYRRQMRRLEENGQTEFEIAQHEDDILDAFEGFLTLELLGWKGRRGTALYNQKRVAAFSRHVVAGLAASSGCEIFSLKQDGRVIAALIMLGRNGHFYTWKMAYDESLSAFSPGVQIMLKAGETLLERDDFVEADSLAVADHWMMNHLWPDRIAMQDLAIAVDPRADSLLRKLVAGKKRQDRMKQIGRLWLEKVRRFRTATS